MPERAEKQKVTPVGRVRRAIEKFESGTKTYARRNPTLGSNPILSEKKEKRGRYPFPLEENY